MYVRRLSIYFDALSFSQVSQLFHTFQIFYENGKRDMTRIASLSELDQREGTSSTKGTVKMISPTNEYYSMYLDTVLFQTAASILTPAHSQTHPWRNPLFSVDATSPERVRN